MSVRDWLRAFGRGFVAGIDPRSPTAGWATRGLHVAFRDAMLTGSLALHVLVGLGAIGHVDAPGRLAALVLMILVSAAVTWLALRGRIHAGWTVYSTYGVALLAVGVAASPADLLVFSGNWLVLLASALPACFLPGWPAFVVHFAGCVGYSVMVAVLHPQWGPTIPEGQVIAGYSIMLALRAGVAMLTIVAAEADARTEAAERELTRSSWLRGVRQEAAESARTLHDTVINTLAAVAAGGAATRNVELVRERCASDRAVVEALQHGAPLGSVDSPFASLQHVGITVHRTGLRDAELELALAELPRPVVDAMERAAHELVQNAAKHAYVREVDLDVARVEGRLRVTVADEGVGFDVARATPRGLQDSVGRRSQERGIDLDLTSTPGQGTTAVLTLPSAEVARRGTDPTIRLVRPETLETTVATIRSGAVWLWALGVLLVGVALEVTSQPGRWTPAYGSLALGLVAVVVGWQTRDATRTVRLAAQGTLVTLAVAGSVLAAATSSFGQVEPVLWQVLTTTGVLVILWSGSPAAGRVGLAAHLGTSVSMAILVAPRSADAALIMVAGGLIGALFVLGWARFDRAVGEVSQRLAHDRRQLVAVDLEARLRAAADTARLRWRESGLERVHVLLEGLADGTLDPSDEGVRRRCGQEESYLRQLIQLDPGLVRLGDRLVRALASARERAVQLVIRTDDSDAPSEAVAEEIGALLLVSLSSLDPGEMLTVTSRSDDHRLSLTLVAPRGRLTVAAHAAVSCAGETGTLVSVADQDLIEVRFPVAVEEISSSG